MRIVLDTNVSAPSIRQALEARGHEVLSIGDTPLAGALDEDLAEAIHDHEIQITADLH